MKNTLLAICLSATSLIATASPLQVGYASSVYGNLNNSQISDMSALLSEQGMVGTAMNSSSFATATLGNYDILVLENISSSSDFIASRRSELSNWVSQGGGLIVSDWNTSSGAIGTYNLLFGQATAQAGTCCSDNLSVFAGTAISAGPYGSLTNASLDNLGTSSHRPILANTLTGSIDAFVYEDNATNELVAFGYEFGDGYIYYSTSPWFHRFGSGSYAPHLAYRTDYAPNVVAYVATEVNSNAIPEPSVLLLALSGFGLLGLSKLRKPVRLAS